MSGPFEARYIALRDEHEEQMDELFSAWSAAGEGTDSDDGITTLELRAREDTAWDDILAFQELHGMEGWNSCMCYSCTWEWIVEQQRLGRTA